MIPVELGETSWHRQHFYEMSNIEILLAKLNLIHKVREEARIREATTKQTATRCYNT